MERRDFCKLLAIAAASKALPTSAQTAQETQPGLPSDFNRYTQDYAQFCALPPEKRVFYKVSDGKIVEERLDEAAWQPPAWNYNSHAAVDCGRTLERCAFELAIPGSGGRWSIQTHVGFVA